MSFLTRPFFRKYLLPGFVFQSIIIAGGYGTGRELVEYFLKFGPLGGLLGMLLVTTTIWAVILAVTFEFSRVFHAYDYRTFSLNLLGRFWFVFEILFLINMLLVLAVIGSAAGIIIRDNFGLPYLVGVLIMLSVIGFLTFEGSGTIAKFLSIWSFVLYAVYIIFFIVSFFKFGSQIEESLSRAVILPRWSISGFKYALYNIANIPGVFFCLNYLEKRKEAIWAGCLGSLIGIIPGLFFYLAILGHYPSILPQEIPAVFAIQRLRFPLLLILFQVVLFGTLIETGTGFIHAVNERIQTTLRERGKELPRWARPLIAFILLCCGLGISTFGLIPLIAKGYGGLSWGVFLVFILPLLGAGVLKIKNKSSCSSS